MDNHVSERIGRTVTAPAACRDAGPIPEPLPACDRRTRLMAIPLALVVIAAFVPILDNGFVLWDDERNFLANPFYRGLGAAQVKWAFSTFWVGAYQPLAWLLFEAQYVFWQLDPRGYHLTSVLLHAANAVVLYVLTVAFLVRCGTDSCLKSPWTCALGAGLATALFAVHPLRVEAVAWASCQPYLPCALFSMLAVLAYLRAFRLGPSPRWGWLVGSFLLFVAALLSHATAVSLPVVMLILDVYPLRRFGSGSGRRFGSSAWKALLEKVPFVIVSLVFVDLAIAARLPSGVSIKHYRASGGIAQACYGIWFYIVKTVLPLNLNAHYPLPGEISWLAPPFLLSILGTLAMSVGLFLLRQRWPGMLAAWLSYLVILAPNSGFIRVSDEIAADRYSYMTMLGWVVLAAGCLCRLYQASSRARPRAVVMITLSLGALLGLAAMTRDQCRTWRDSEALSTHALNHGAGNSSTAHNNMGVVLYRHGKLEAAAAQYARALRLDPGSAEAHLNLGILLSHQGQLEAAAAQYARALRLDPGSAEAHYNLGVILSRQGKVAAAAAHYAQAVRLNPGYAEAHYNLGVLLSRQGSWRRRRPITPRRCGSIPVSPRRTIIWESSSHARGSWRRPRLITPRRCGLIPASSPHTTTWVATSPTRGSTMRLRLITLRRCGSIPGTPTRTTTTRRSWLPVPKRSTVTARERSNRQPAPASWRSGRIPAFLTRSPPRMLRPATSTRRSRGRRGRSDF